MTLLTRDQIIAADDVQEEVVPVPEWGGEVLIRGMNGTARNAYQSSLVQLGPNGKPQGVNLSNQLAKLLARCIVDEGGQPLFDVGDVKELGAKNGAVLERLGKVARRLSGLQDRAVEDAEGNSEAAPSGSSPSA
ncbi:hypothetical protein ACFUJU_28730 [Streptomyces sp. NPDC057235]|uniref:hypothetical protein n=1 Tax=Streptomyces sp. NPDC057235 TaxID=3346058 RepID=UPI00362956BF